MRRGFSPEKLSRIKRTRGLSYRDLQKLTDIPASTICRYCKGHTCPSVNKARILENALKVKKGTLFF